MTADLRTHRCRPSLVQLALRWGLSGTIAMAVLPAGAAPTSGTFVDDDQLFIDASTLPVAAQLNVATRSWALGAFAPVLALFDDSSGLLLQLDAGSSHACGQAGAGAADAATGFCWDAFFDTVLPAGHYALVLSQDGNAPTGDRASGASFQSLYPQTGNPDYTGLSFLGQAGRASSTSTGASAKEPGRSSGASTRCRCPSRPWARCWPRPPWPWR